MTQRGKSDRGSNSGNGKKEQKGGQSYVEQAKELFARFRAEIAAAADKLDKKYLDFRLDEIVGRFSKDGRFVPGQMAHDQLQMLIDASGVTYQVVDTAIEAFPAVFGDVERPNKRCNVRTMVRALALIVAYKVADEESKRVADAHAAEKAALVAEINSTLTPFKPTMVRTADGQLDVVPVAVEPETPAAAGTGS